MGMLDGKVALITGGARGQGRAHAVTCAREGADVIIADAIDQLPTVPYKLATKDDLDETARLVEACGRRVIAVKADVRSQEQLDAADSGAGPVAAGPRPPRRLVPIDAPAENVGLPVADDFAAGKELRLTQEELLEQAGIDAAALAELQQYGLVRPGPAGFFDPDAVLVARTVKAMTEFGIEPRHLRAFRAAADREVGLLEQIVTPVYRHRDPEAGARADEVVRELAALSVTLHTLLVKAGIRSVSGC